MRFVICWFLQLQKDFQQNILYGDSQSSESQREGRKNMIYI